MPRNNKHPKHQTFPTTTTQPSTHPNTIYFYHPSPSTHPHAYLCQMYPSPFTHPSLPSITFTSAEQWMMYHKALTFSSPQTAQKILTLSSAPEMKYLVRGLKPSREDRKEWERRKVGVVEEGNWGKFRWGGGDGGGGDGEVVGNGGVRVQIGELGRRLLGTGERELVEAARNDRVWGVGFEEGEAEGRRAEWGMNLLGGVLMGVRARLREVVEKEMGEREVDRGREGETWQRRKEGTEGEGEAEILEDQKDDRG